MRLLDVLRVASLIVTVGASLSGQYPFSVDGTEATTVSINWKSCGSIFFHPLECGRLSVPLDYARPSIGNASLSLFRLRADPEKRKGTVLTNPGGPGVPGTGPWMRYRAPDIFDKLGQEYDVVSWDIRGVNDTKPSVQCFDSADVARQFWNNSLWFQGVETNSSLQSDFDRTNFYSHVNDEDTRLRELWNHCNSTSGPALRYVV